MHSALNMYSTCVHHVHNAHYVPYMCSPCTQCVLTMHSLLTMFFICVHHVHNAHYVPCMRSPCTQSALTMYSVLTTCAICVHHVLSMCSRDGICPKMWFPQSWCPSVSELVPRRLAGNRLFRLVRVGCCQKYDAVGLRALPSATHRPLPPPCHCRHRQHNRHDSGGSHGATVVSGVTGGGDCNQVMLMVPCSRDYAGNMVQLLVAVLVVGVGGGHGWRGWRRW
jgi:hypothetical protein